MNPDTVNLIEEKERNSLEQIGRGGNFVNTTPTALTLIATINKWDLIKLKSFSKAQNTSKELNFSLQNGKQSSPTLHLTEC